MDKVTFQKEIEFNKNEAQQLIGKHQVLEYVTDSYVIQRVIDNDKIGKFPQLTIPYWRIEEMDRYLYGGEYKLVLIVETLWHSN